MKIYTIPPIDFFWNSLPTVNQTLATIGHTEDTLTYPDKLDTGIVKKFATDWEEAKKLAKSEGWEGLYREEPRVFWLPSDTEFSYGFAIKQENNGTTFIISPQPLSWLEQLVL